MGEDMGWKIIICCIVLVLLVPGYTSASEIVTAAMNGDLEKIKAILSSDTSKLNDLDEYKYTAAHWAGMRAHWDVMEYLIKQGADMNIVGGDGGTPINWAVHHDNRRIIKMMIDHGAKLNIQNQWGMTELHTAVWRGCRNVTDYLLNEGSDPDIRTKEGWTVLHMVYRSGHLPIIEMFKSRGLVHELRDNEGRKPEELFFKRPKSIKMSKSEMKEYVGKFYVKEYLILDIWMEDEKLKIMEFGPDEIYPVAKDKFYFKQAPWTLVFKRNGENVIEGADLSFIRRTFYIEKR